VLPAPAGKFILMLRMHWPTEDRSFDHRRDADDTARKEGLTASAMRGGACPASGRARSFGMTMCAGA